MFTAEENQLLTKAFDQHLADGHLDQADDAAIEADFLRAYGQYGPALPGGLDGCGDLALEVALGAVASDGGARDEAALIDAAIQAVNQSETADQRARTTDRLRAARELFRMCLQIRKTLRGFNLKRTSNDAG